METHEARSHRRYVLLPFILLFVATAGAGQEPEPAQLFRNIDQAVAITLDAAEINEPTVARSRFVELRADVLEREVTNLAADSGPPAPVQLELFDDLSVTINSRKVESLDGDSMSWIGTLEGADTSTVIFIITKDAEGKESLTGNIVSDGTLYQIRSAGGSIHEVREINQDEYPDELPPDPAPASQQLEEGTPAGDALPDDPQDEDNNIQILVLYTEDAMSGGNVEAEIRLAIQETNQSYETSGIRQRLRLSHMHKVDYNETGELRKDRNRLQMKSDGFLDIAHSLRDEHKADLVSLWVRNGGQYCGIAYIMEEVNTSFEAYGFSVVKRDCATGYYSFGHELGHNMGARHDRFVDPTDGSPFLFNHGFFRTSPTTQGCQPWRTVMGYNNGCGQEGVSCTRLAFWSNPDRNHCGDPTGLSGSADNRLTLERTASTVAAFR